MNSKKGVLWQESYSHSAIKFNNGVLRQQIKKKKKTLKTWSKKFRSDRLNCIWRNSLCTLSQIAQWAVSHHKICYEYVTATGEAASATLLPSLYFFKKFLFETASYIG